MPTRHGGADRVVCVGFCFWGGFLLQGPDLAQLRAGSSDPVTRRPTVTPEQIAKPGPSHRAGR
ncbi:hypothetical protein [Gordonia sp. ABSL49_1]|uniref:hypothetical protein n=1 Tax=Gordonia sp. ABSL49_1 TaxID=2920941 RepID=UPI001F0D8612|nr:hypothetical protein [Gordonia sp. ABSL49_1]MCH5645548.1 hypothetical protein [Gordonia sp. ABSL49_1]